MLAGGCGGGGSASASGSASGSASAAAAEASRVVEGLPPHTGLQLRASFLFVDAWRGEPLRYSPHKTVQTLTALSRPAQPRAALTARCSPLQPPYRRLTAPSQRPTATHSHLHPPPRAQSPPLTGEHAYAKVDGAHVWLDHYDARAGSGGVDVCGGPTPERRMRIPVTANVPHNARCALSPCTYSAFYI